MQRRAVDSEILGSSLFDVTKWPQYWETGAKELEKTAPGRLITAPIRLPEAVFTSATETVKQVPDVLKTVTKSIPMILLAAVVLGGGFVVYKFTKGKRGINAPASTL